MAQLMNTIRRTTRAQRAALLSGALLPVALGVLACAIDSRRDIAPQEWWRGRGPVVPHDGFPADCSLCHTGEGWNEIRADFTFDHEAMTGMELEGAHAGAECLRCHNDRGPVELFAARGCAGCHEDVHQGKLGRECTTCHGQSDWRPSEQIAMHNRTRFPLVGVHAATACWRCHPGAQVGNFQRADTECASCHRADLARALTPNHVAQGWTAACDRCHIPTTWTGAGFNHGFFRLAGGHAGLACEACHTAGSFAGTPRDCVACHLDDYNQAGDPDHVALGFPTSCEICHDIHGWEGARFVHLGLAGNCVDCHFADYQGTSDPNHAAAGFPTSCEDCHNTSGWGGASFDHSFLINSGKHNNFSCADCHLNPATLTQFSCTHCHDHSKSMMDDEHKEVGGYVWSSPLCLSCHPQGKE